MPSRSNIFVNGYFYHIYDKSLDDLCPFDSQSSISYLINLLEYYRYVDIKISFSKMSSLDPHTKDIHLKNLQLSGSRVVIIAYCLMPNHYHFLLRQKHKYGISRFMSDIINSFTRYYNIKHERRGPIFLPSFRSKPIMNEEQLIHVSRYIHLNPFAANLVQTKNDIWTYPYSSAWHYLAGCDGLVESDHIVKTSYFGGDSNKYKMFVESEAEQARTSALTKYLKKW